MTINQAPQSIATFAHIGQMFWKNTVIVRNVQGIDGCYRVRYQQAKLMDDGQELLLDLRQRKQVAQEAFMDAQRAFLEAQHAYVDASQAMKSSADLKDCAAAVLAAAEPYLAALETLRNTQMQAEPSQERDVEDAHLEKLQMALENQVETFRQALLQHR